MSNLVWTKSSTTGNVWWVGEKLVDPPEEIIKNSKKEVLAVVKFFNPEEIPQVVTNPKNVVEYETNKEDNIRSGLRSLKKKESLLKEFINDVLEAEKRIGGDEKIIERLSESANSTPRKSVVAEIFKTTPVQKKSPAISTPVAPASSAKSNVKKTPASPRKSKVPTPTPQVLSSSAMKYVCDVCNFSCNRVNVITSHKKSHTVESTIPTPTVVKSLHKPVVPTPERPSTSRSTRQVKASPATVTPKRVPARKSVKRKVSATPPKEIAKEEILADWSDAEEEANQKDKKKIKKDFHSIFDNLLKTTNTTSETSEDKTGEASDTAPQLLKEDTDDDQMDVDEMPTLSNSNAPVAELIQAPQEEPLKEAEEKDEDLDAQFNELMKETTITLPTFDAPKQTDTVNAENKILSDDAEQTLNEEVKQESIPCSPKKEDSSTKVEVTEENLIKNESELDEAPVTEDEPISQANHDDTNIETASVEQVKEQIVTDIAVTVKEPVQNDTPVVALVSPKALSPTKKIALSPPRSISPAKTVTPEIVKVLPPSIVSKPKVETPGPSQPTGPVYAVKSVPQLIEEKPKRTYSRGRRSLSAKAKGSETANSEAVFDVKDNAKLKSPEKKAVAADKAIDEKVQPQRNKRPSNSYIANSTPRKKETTIAKPVTVATSSLIPSSANMVSSAIAPKSPVKPATSGPSSPVKPATSVPPSPVKPATSGPSSPVKPATSVPPSPVKPATSGPSSPVKPATKVTQVVEPPVQSTSPVKSRAAITEPAKPISPTKAVPQRATPVRAPRKSSVEAKKSTLVSTVQPSPEKGKKGPPLQQQYLITSYDGAVIAPEATAIATSTVEAVKKPTASVASSSPTASSLALAQRKKDLLAGPAPAPTPPKPKGRIYPGRKSQPGTSEVATAKPTATVKPTVNVEDDSIIRQALQGTIKSSPPVEQKKEAPVEQVVHVVPVQNPDGSVSYMFLSLDDSDELKLDQLQGSIGSNNLEAVYIDKSVDGDMVTLNPQQSQQIQMQVPQNFNPQAPSRQPPVSQQVKQQIAATAIASSSSSQPQFVSETVVAPQQYVIQQEGQEILNIGQNIVQNEDGSYVDFSQLTSGDNNIYFMTEDGSIIDPSSCGMSGAELQQLFQTQ